MIELHSLATHVCHGSTKFKILEFLDEDHRLVKAGNHPQYDFFVISDVKHFSLVE